MRLRLTVPPLLSATFALAGCNPDSPADTSSSSETSSSTATESESGETGDPEPLDTYGFANGCYTVRSGDTWLAASASGDAFEFVADANAAAHFFMKASDLGTYVFYDQNGGYLVSEGGPLLRQTTLQSDMSLNDDTYVSGAEWLPENSDVDPTQYQLRNRKTDQLLASGGVAAEGLPVTFEDVDGCREYPELTLDANGTVMRTTFDDGTLYGIVDTHSHVLSNFGFGGGSLFHGAPFHRLGVEHALPDCAPFHGEMGRKDFFGYVFDQGGAGGGDLTSLLPDLVAGELSVDNHMTAGYPEFTDWPNGPTRSTHQVQYYRWLERAYLAGLRLEVLHATTNSVICNFTVGAGLQQSRYACDDMVAVDRILDEAYVMERYIDAQSGGPGLGWFRIVKTPAEAREQIMAGKMAVVLGIETANLFECTLTPVDGNPVCDEAYVKERLDHYYEVGVRALFPVHKYDNKFTPGDGDRGFIELGNFVNSGQWGNFTTDCPPGLSTLGFDGGDVYFGGLNMPRDVYDQPPPNDLSHYPEDPVGIISLYIQEILAPPLMGPYCQNATMTPLGETLLHEMMLRGMLIEVDHLPQWSYVRAYELLEAADYPPVGSHGRNYDGRIYQLGGVSAGGFGVCREAMPGATVQGFVDKIQFITQNGGYPAEGFGFDLNGFAGARGPRFGDGICSTVQTDPITYPFDSFAGDIQFTEPVIGDRTLDFNTEGLVHIGLLPEMIEDARRDALSDDDIEPLFRSAEGYIRMWEKAEARAAALGG